MTREIVSDSKSDWGTPQWLFDALHKEFNFDIDLCAAAYNAKMPVYFDKESDAFTQDWTQYRGFCNPPYFEIERWLRKATQGGFSVFLIPGNTDTKWFHEYAAQGRIEFFKGRVSFVDQTPPELEIERYLILLSKADTQVKKDKVVTKIVDILVDLPSDYVSKFDMLRSAQVMLSAQLEGKTKKKKPGPGFPSILVIFGDGRGGTFGTRSAKTGEIL